MPLRQAGCETASGLALLFADRKLGAASKLAFLQLWDFAGGAPGRVVITADWLAGVCGRSPKAAWLWLGELESHDLVKLGERNERRGTVVVDVYNPCPGGRGQVVDPQTRLAIGSGEFTPAIDAEVSAPKPPSPLVPKKVSTISCQSTNASKAPMNSLDSMGGVFSTAAAIAVGAAEPAVQKERLKRRIFSVCGGVAGVAEWVAGSAANLVVYHGVPIEDLDRILGDVDAMRCAGTLRNAGSFFHSKVKQLADRHGKPWPRPR